MTLISTTHNAPWLPARSRAEVALDVGGEAPSPTCLVRLLVVRDGHVFCVPRGGGGKLDLPTRAVGDFADGSGAAEALASEVLGVPGGVSLRGYVRNVVDEPDEGYPWPSPHAHFAVFTARGDQPAVPGQWLDLAAEASPLRDRHWWPLAAWSPKAD